MLEVLLKYLMGKMLHLIIIIITIKKHESLCEKVSNDLGYAFVSLKTLKLH